MTTLDDLFDHDRHVALLDSASNELYRHGDSETDKRHQAMAGACGRAASLHRQLRSRVAHARQVERQLERLERLLIESAPIITGDMPITMEGAAARVRKAMSTLRGYVSQPNAPWIGPAPVMFPLPTDPDPEDT